MIAFIVILLSFSQLLSSFTDLLASVCCRVKGTDIFN